MTIGENSMSIPNRIRLAREQAGLSQGKVAKMLGYHRPTISEIEAGRRKVTAEEIAKFAEIFRVSVVWLSAARSDSSDLRNNEARIELAARELSKITRDDLDKILSLLSTLRDQRK